jgi:N-methylhydantoinase A
LGPAGGRRFRIGVDIGGTFTDLCVAGDEGLVAIGKTLTTREEPASAIETVIRETLEANGIGIDEISDIVHGTTLVTNAIIERKGSPTALLATAGHRDAIEIARERRYEIYDLDIELPQPLVPRHLRFDIPERTMADGTIAEEVDVQFVRALARELVEHGIEAVAIAFLHSFTNPRNEQRAADAIREAAPDLRVSLSSEVAPEIREYERSSTTVANVYVQKLVEQYLADLQERLARLGFSGSLHIMLSNGGIATPETAARFPIRLLESGPAGGALAAAAFGSLAKTGDLLSFDMGGTTAKLCVIEDGEPLIAPEFEVDRIYRLKRGSGVPVRTAVVDMIEIGAGGGSIARIDALGLVTVGPDSSGSDPGPACYGLGGVEPTVTDADLVLGYLDPDSFLGGRMRLDLEAAREAIRQHIAEPLGVTVEDAAYGIHDLVNESMTSAARVHALERGKDPASLPLFAFGGAGPVHACGVARALGAPWVLGPPAAGVLSAIGFLTAPLAFDFVRSVQTKVEDLVWAEVAARFVQMEEAGAAILTTSAVSQESVAHRRFADMRYQGQGYDIRVPVGGVAEDWPRPLLASFDEVYRTLYERPGPPVPLEVVNLRVVSSGPRPALTLTRTAARNGRPPSSTRRAWFPEAGGYVDTAVYDRYALSVGAAIEGPAIVEERESTFVIPPAARCTMAGDGSLVVELAR